MSGNSQQLAAESIVPDRIAFQLQSVKEERAPVLCVATHKLAETRRRDCRFQLLEICGLASVTNAVIDDAHNDLALHRIESRHGFTDWRR